MHCKNLIVLVLLGITLLLSSKTALSQPSVCWENLVLKPQSVSMDNNSYEIKGKVVYFQEVNYFQKLRHDEVGVHYHLGNGKIEDWDHLTVYISPDTSLTIYSREAMTTNTVMGFVRCYDISRAKEILQALYPGYLHGNVAVDTLADLIIYMGDENFPKWEYMSLSEGKVIITYNIETGDTTVEFVGMRPSDSPVFKLPEFVIN